MPNKTAIEYVDYTSNAIYAVRLDNNKRGWHCVHASPGCEKCYAEKINLRWGTGLRFIAQNDDKVKFGLSMKEIDALLKLDARLAKRGETARVFVGDMLDIFHRTVPDFMLTEFFDALERCTSLTLLTLTKRAGRQREFLKKRWATRTPPAHIHVGVSAEDQKRADERIPLLLSTPAAVRWVSCEPLLGPVDLTAIPRTRAEGFMRPLDGRFNTLDWVVVGYESGSGARAGHPTWAQELRQQCKEANVPYFFKQWGQYRVCTPEEVENCQYDTVVEGRSECGYYCDETVGHVDHNPAFMRNVGKKTAGRLLDGREHNDFPQARTSTAPQEGAQRA